jgi:hypothetical protein
LPEKNTMKRVLLFSVLLASVGSIRVLLARVVQAPADEENVVLYGSTGADLLTYCSDVGTLKAGETIPAVQLADVAKHVGMCSGYIAGVNDAAIGYGSQMNSMKRLYCIPPKAGLDQLIRVVRKSLEDNPSQLHLPSSVLVIRALKNAFPCGR